MCRFVAYSGNQLLLDDILHKPENSLVNQSIRASEAVEPLNGDGFGVGWYAHDIDDEPGVYTSIQPAWNEHNLKNISKKIRTPLLFAHVRSANVGDVTTQNCHPFTYKNFMCMHNGCINDFDKFKRALRRVLPDHLYENLKGQTDSEHFFALFLYNLEKLNVADVSLDIMFKAFKNTLLDIAELTRESSAVDDHFLNMVITDGKRILASRYATNPESQPRSLYYSVGKHFKYEDGACHMLPGDNERNGAVLIASERLDSMEAAWIRVAANQCVLVDEDLSVTVCAID